MVNSPYEAAIAAFLEDLNNQFAILFELNKPFRVEDIHPGESFGIISVNTYQKGEYKAASGIEKRPLSLDVLLMVGSTNAIAAQKLASQYLLKLEHGVSSLRDHVDGHGVVYDLFQDGEVTAVFRQSIKPPNNYIIDLTTQAIAMLAIRKDATGKHIPL